MNYKAKGKITEISEVKEISNGAKSLFYKIDTEEQYNNILKIDYYCPPDKLDYLDKFLEYNKIGDTVEAQFSIRLIEGVSKAGNDYSITSLSHFRVDKVEKQESKRVINNDPKPSENTTDDEEDLPF